MLHDNATVIFETIMAVVILLIMLCSILCNVIVIVGITRSYHEKKLTDYFLMAMALSDFCRIFVAGSLEIRSLLVHHFEFGLTTCIVESVFVRFLEFISIGFILSLALDRYLSVVKPIVAATIYQEKKYVWMMFTINIAYAFFWAILPVAGLGEYGIQGAVQCGLIPTVETTSKIYFTLLLLFVFIIPFTLIFIFAYATRKKIKQNHAFERRTQSNTVTIPCLGADDKAKLRFIFAVAIAFALTWIPYNITLVEEIFTDGHSNEYVEVITMCFVKSSAFIFPLISILLYKNLRDTLLKLKRNVLGQRRSSIIAPRVSFAEPECSTQFDTRRCSTAI